MTQAEEIKLCLSCPLKKCIPTAAAGCPLRSAVNKEKKTAAMKREAKKLYKRAYRARQRQAATVAQHP